MIKPVTNILKFICLAILALTLLSPITAFAAPVTNTADGDVAGDATALGSGSFTIDITTLSIVKAAFLNADGTALTNNDAVARGTLVDFMLYVDNTTAATMFDIAMTDILPTGFTYQTNSLRIGTLGTLSTADALYAQIKGASGTAVSDAEAAGDVAGINVVGPITTITVGNNVGQPNDQLDILATAGNQMWGIVFTVQLQ